MKILKDYLIIMLCLLFGEFISRIFHLLIPGNVIGMISLLVLLLLGIVKLKDVEKGADNLIGNMSLFFVPVGAGIILYFDVLSKYGMPIFVSTIISTILVIIVTGHTTQLLINYKNRKGDNNG